MNPVPNALQVEIKRTAGPFGIAALVLGIIACVGCWIPFLGLLVIPLALVGLLLAFAGLVMAGVTKKTGFAFPISGGIICLVSLFIAFAVTGGIAAAFQKAATNRNQTNQENESKATNQTAAMDQDWATSRSVKQGDIRITIKEVVVSHSGPPDLAIAITVANLSSNKKVDFTEWSGASFGIGREYVTLTDNYQNRYKRIVSDTASTSSIYPQKESGNALVFEPPVNNIKWLHLELPAENFEGHGMLRFEIPMSKIMAAWVDYKKVMEETGIAGPYYENQVPKAKSDRLKAAKSRLEAAEKGLE